ncbi:hypothetical protein XCR1_1150025 [Xenorhabdus cabanillasii JM26]|uniref:Uncharacterized protein n=1 Tax=Xenorhabdus cabanillasii JM26 TaxID=1427517 RepID=W1INT5_9GAMM|nr:hypothetical protein XCR1_1150025 [Xenorhabdus cabanillasii JM26]
MDKDHQLLHKQETEVPEELNIAEDPEDKDAIHERQKPRKITLAIFLGSY